MSKVVPFVKITKQSILREGKRELLRIYQISAGGSDPVADDSAREDFEAGYLDEMPWKNFVECIFNMYLEEDE